MNGVLPNILIAGIGNIFLGDDAFGVEVAQHLMRRQWPSNVRVRDFGIRGLDLAYAMAEGVDVAIFVDAAPRGQTPGTLQVIEVEMPDATAQADPLTLDTHSIDPVRVLRLTASMDAKVQRVLVVGCEPENPSGDDDMQAGLSEAVERAIPEAVLLVTSLVERLNSEASGVAENANAIVGS